MEEERKWRQFEEAYTDKKLKRRREKTQPNSAPISVLADPPATSISNVIPVCPDDSKPRVGMLFKTLDEGIKFYKDYAALVGFDIRKSATKKSGGVIVWQYVVCSREGEKHFASVSNATQNPDDEQSIYTQIRRVSNRVGCNARVRFRLAGICGYSIKSFEEGHNHPLLSMSSRAFLKLHRNMDICHKKFMLNYAKANIGTMKSFRLFKESVGGYNNIGASAVDFKNFRRDLKAYIHGGDAQMLIDKLFRKRELCSSFYFAYEVDESDRLKCLFLSDPVTRKNYALFGDVVSFDATYDTNSYKMVFGPFTGVDNHQNCVSFGFGLITREDADSYTWLFQHFLKEMIHPPKCIITDQDASICIAIPNVFASSTHRFCMWHIMYKVGKKVGLVLSKDEVFMKRLNGIVWSHYLEPVDFEQQWKDVLSDYDLISDSWFTLLFNIRESWIPAYLRDSFMAGHLRTTSRSESSNNFFDEFLNKNFSLVEFLMQFESAMDSQRHKHPALNVMSEAYTPVFKTPLPIEKHASSIYTLSVFYDVQEEICAACFSCRVIRVEGESEMEFVIKDNKNFVFTVLYSSTNGSAVCSCKDYQRVGLLCRHIFLVFKDMHIDKIPGTYISSRWCKIHLVQPMFEVPDDAFQDVSKVEEQNLLIERLWSDFHYCIAIAEQKPDLLLPFSTIIKQHKEKLHAHMNFSRKEHVEKANVFETFCGISAPKDVSVLPPQQAHNKGSGKRIKSVKEQLVEEGRKKKRLFRNCKKLGHHDSRNCPLNDSS